MKSSVPKVLHSVAGAYDRPCARGGGAPRPKTTTAVVGHQLDTLTTALTAYPGVRLWFRSPSWAPPRALTTESVLRGQMESWSSCPGCPLLSPDTLKTLVERHAATVPPPQSSRRWCRIRPVWPHVRPATVPHCREKDAGPAERGSVGSTGNLRSRSTACSTPCGASKLTMRRASITFPIWWPSTDSRAGSKITVSSSDEIQGINSRSSSRR
jgi:hypothetical protein